MRLVAGVVALVVCVHAGLWTLLRDESKAPNINGPLASVSYSPYRSDPADGNRPETAQMAAQVRSDLKIIAPYTRAVRTYDSTCGAEQVAEIATEFDLRVTVGAWIQKEPKDKDDRCVSSKKSGADNEEVLSRNEREVRAALDLAKKHRNVDAIVIGNEAIFSHQLEPDDDDVKANERGTIDPEEKKKFMILDPEELKRIKEAPNPAPPLFLAVAADDTWAAQRSIEVFTAYRKSKGLAELHVFQMGEHGFVNKGGGADHFMDRLQEWLAANKLLSKAEAGTATPP